MTALVVRPAEPADVPRIAAAHVRSFAETYGHVLRESTLATNSLERRTRMWSAIVGEGARDVFVACAGDDIVGFGSGGAMQDLGALREPIADFEAYIDTTHVLRAYQRSLLGAGVRLVHAVAGALIARGYRSAATHVVSSLPARSFIERLGGTLLREEILDDTPAAMQECIYGWRDLRVLFDRSAARPRACKIKRSNSLTDRTSRA